MASAASAQTPAPPNPGAPPASGPSLAEQIAALHWVSAPASLTLGGNSTVAIPAGDEMLAPPDAVTYLQLNGNPTTDDDNGDYILQPTDPNATWFALFYYVDSGHVADSGKIDADQLLADAKQGSQEDNAERQKDGMPTLTLQGWAQQPQYDPVTHRLQWAFTFANPDGSQTINLDTRILGRTGYYKVVLVDDPKALTADMPSFNAALDAFAFNQGQRYADYQAGDKTAEYGIAGLIAGGAAAAVVAKTGLLGGIIAALAAWSKAIIAAVIAAVALLRRKLAGLFGKKSS
jgi:uncharacterized membrane-anchored protein